MFIVALFIIAKTGNNLDLSFHRNMDTCNIIMQQSIIQPLKQLPHEIADKWMKEGEKIIMSEVSQAYGMHLFVCRY